MCLSNTSFLACVVFQLTRKVRLLTVFWDSGFYFHFANLFFFLKMKDKVLASVTVISN